MAAVTAGLAAATFVVHIGPRPATRAAACCAGVRRHATGYPRSLVPGSPTTPATRAPGDGWRVHATLSGLRDSRVSGREHSAACASAVRSRRAGRPAYTCTGRATASLSAEFWRRTGNGASGTAVIRRRIAVDNAFAHASAAVSGVLYSAAADTWWLLRVVVGQSAAARWLLRIFPSWTTTAG